MATDVPTSHQSTTARDPIHATDGSSVFGRQTGSSIDIPGYKLGREIGRGHHVVVYSGCQKATGLKVAIKILVGGNRYSQENLNRFEREADVLGALDHPNVVKIIDRGISVWGEQFMVVNSVAGERLDQWLTRFRVGHDPVSKQDDLLSLMRVFLKICDAINAAHIRGVIHSNIKPSSILVDERGDPHIVDFGFARTPLNSRGGNEDLDGMSMNGRSGSLPWASPELAQGLTSSLDLRTDVYSLGALLYQFLTGEPPFCPNASMPQLLDSVLHQVPMAPTMRMERSLVAAGADKIKVHAMVGDPVWVGLDAVVLKSLAKARKNRHQTAGELARDVSAILNRRTSEASKIQSSNALRAVFSWFRKAR